MTLRDARSNDAFRIEAQKLSPLGTIPVWVRSENGVEHVLGDSTAISRWLDRSFPESAPLWPRDAANAEIALEVAALVDSTLNTVIDAGTRYFALAGASAWESVRAARIQRVQAMFERLAAIAQARGPLLAGNTWTAADIWLTTMVLWFESLPARAKVYAPVAQILTLGYEVPSALNAWADAHRSRADILALDP